MNQEDSVPIFSVTITRYEGQLHLIVFLVFLLFFSNFPASAAGLGNITILSHLGEPFRADVALIGNNQQISGACSVANLLSGDNSELMPAKIHTDTDTPSVLHISTIHPLSEPACFLRLSINCQHDTEQRTYALLLDLPPANIQPSTVPVAVEIMPTATLETIPAPPKTHHTAKRTARLSAHATARHATHSAHAANTHTSHPHSAWLSVSEEPPVAQDGLRLHFSTQLDPALIEQATQNAAQLQAAKTHLQQLLQPQPNDVMHELKLEQAQVESMQLEIRQLKQLHALNNNQKATSWQTLPTWLAAAEFLALLLLLSYQFRHKKNPAEWWEHLDTPAAAGAPTPATVATTATTARAATPTEEPAKITAPDVIGHRTQTAEAHARTPSPSYYTPNQPAAHPATVTQSGENNIEVQELSDITQEAEFWISVNNPDKAIELLESQTGLDTQDSPAPWLYLFDLYRNTRQAEKYETLKNQISRHFNVNVPAYEDDAAFFETRHLEDYPHLVKKITTLWKQPGIITYLRELLLVDKTREKRLGFDLSVYKEIIMLIGVAQEIERNGPDTANPRPAIADDLDLNMDDLHDAFRVV